MSKTTQTNKIERSFVRTNRFIYGELAEYEILGQMLLSKQRKKHFSKLSLLEMI